MSFPTIPTDVFVNIVDCAAYLTNDPATRPRRYGHSPAAAHTLRHLCLASRTISAIATRRLYATISLRDPTTFHLLFRTLTGPTPTPPGARVALIRRLFLGVSWARLAMAGTRAWQVEALLTWLAKYKSTPCLAIHPDLTLNPAFPPLLARLSKLGELLIVDAPQAGAAPSTRISLPPPLWSKHTQLRRLALSDALAPAADSEALRALAALRSLRFLVLDHTPGTPEREQALLDALFQADRFRHLERITLVRREKYTAMRASAAANARLGLYVVEITRETFREEVDGDLWEAKGQVLAPV